MAISYATKAANYIAKESDILVSRQGKGPVRAWTGDDDVMALYISGRLDHSCSNNCSD